MCREYACAYSSVTDISLTDPLAAESSMSEPTTGPRTLLSPAELHILLSLAHEDCHGYAIRQAVEERTAGALRLGPGTLYEALHRMLEAGWIAMVRDDDPRRKVYRLADAGRAELRSELERLDEILTFARDHDILDPEPSR